MKRYKVYHYNNLKGYELIDEINVKRLYDNRFYHKPVPTIGERKCKEILKKIRPWFPADGIMVMFEDVETGTKYVQPIHRNGTIIVE